MTSNLPIEHQHWTAKQCAEYLGYSVEEFRRNVRYHAKFPLPLANFDELRPRWAATAVISFAMQPGGRKP